MSPVSPKQGGAQSGQPEEKGRPKPAKASAAKEFNPIPYSGERINVAPVTAGGDLFVPGGLNEQYDPPEVTDTDILDQLLDRFDDEATWKVNEENNNTDDITNEISDIENELANTGYPETSGVGVPAGYKERDHDISAPIETSHDRTDASKRENDTVASFGFLDEDDEDNRRTLIGEFINGKTRVVEKATKE